MTVEPRYEHWNTELTVKAASTKWIAYDTLTALLSNWREVRLSVLEHSSTVLSQISTLGSTNFYGRNKRFGGSMPGGDNLYVRLSGPRIKKILSNTTVALQSVTGEGRTRRLGKEQITPPAAGEDNALNVAHQLAELDELLTDENFLKEEVFTQDKFELVHGLNWTGQ